MAFRRTAMESRELWQAEVKKRWGWIMGLGGLFLAMGLVGLAMVFAVAAPNLSAFGVLLLGGSIAHALQTFRVYGWRNMAVQVAIALVYLGMAALIFMAPAAAPISLVRILATVLLVIGILRIVGGLDAKPMPGWKWLLGTGSIDILLAAMLLTGWPISGLWVIGLVISIDLLVSGIAYVILAVKLGRGAMHA